MDKYRRLLLVALTLAVLLAIFQFSGLRESLSLQYLHDALLAHKFWGWCYSRCYSPWAT